MAGNAGELKQYIEGRIAARLNPAAQRLSQEIDLRIRKASNSVTNLYLSRSSTTDTLRAVEHSHLRTDTVERRVTKAGGLDNGHMANAYLNGNWNVYSMRGLGNHGGCNGTSESACSYNHYHNCSVNFKQQYTKEERVKAIGQMQAVRAIPGTPPPGAAPAVWDAIKAIRDLTLDHWHQLADDPEVSAEDREVMIETDPAFRHQHLMRIDADYAAAFWAETIPEYAARVAEDPAKQAAVEHARLKHGRIETDEQIVRDFYAEHGNTSGLGARVRPTPPARPPADATRDAPGEPPLEGDVVGEAGLDNPAYQLTMAENPFAHPDEYLDPKFRRRR